MAVFAFTTKLGHGSYGMRHTRVRPSVMQCVLAVRETVVIKPSRLNIVAQGLSNLHLYTPLPRVGSDQAAGKQARGVHYKKTERSRSICTSHILSGKPDGVALHYTCPTPEAVPPSKKEVTLSGQTQIINL